MENSQATSKHMNQGGRDPQVVQVNLLRYQCTELPPSKFQRKPKKSLKARQATNKSYQEDTNRGRMTQAYRTFHKINKHMQVMKNILVKTDAVNVVIPHT